LDFAPFARGASLKVKLLRFVRSAKLRIYTGGRPDWAVSVAEPLHLLVLAGVEIRNSWKLWRGARVSPFEQSNILFRTKIVRWKFWVGRDFLKNVITLPLALWGVH
jgi:hypothetical protein